MKSPINRTRATSHGHVVRKAVTHWTQVTFIYIPNMISALLGDAYKKFYLINHTVCCLLKITESFIVNVTLSCLERMLSFRCAHLNKRIQEIQEYGDTRMLKRFIESFLGNQAQYSVPLIGYYSCIRWWSKCHNFSMIWLAQHDAYCHQADSISQLWGGNSQLYCFINLNTKRARKRRDSRVEITLQAANVCSLLPPPLSSFPAQHTYSAHYNYCRCAGNYEITTITKEECLHVFSITSKISTTMNIADFTTNWIFGVSLPLAHLLSRKKKSSWSPRLGHCQMALVTRHPQGWGQTLRAQVCMQCVQLFLQWTFH